MTSRRAFTLVELLVVVGIMGLLGTISVGGYRAMRRGMEEKGVMQNVNTFIRAAYQRAQIDRLPTVVFFWNETLRAATADDNEIVVGKAVAVRRAGRISEVQGQLLCDEFADLELSYPTDQDERGRNTENSFYLYPMDKLSTLESNSKLLRSSVEGKVYQMTIGLTYISGMDGKDLDAGKLYTYAFKLSDANGVQWKAGTAYGFEFANIELPRGFIFGQNYSSSYADPIKEAGTMVFYVGANSGNGQTSGSGMGSRTKVEVYSLRPGSDGSLTAQSVGSSLDPSQSL